MTVQELIDGKEYEVLNPGEDTGRRIETVFCCDLLSVAMGKAPAGCAWVTVMGNMNTAIMMRKGLGGVYTVGS